jgi:hypothetical protein
VASFDIVDYSVRPNKTIERKLIVESLLAMRTRFAVEDYRYVGFGSMWFVDFILLHKVLRISKMVSIELQPKAADRARFNAPYCCIEVIAGESTIILPTLGLDAGPHLLWLDYDSDLAGPLFGDLPIVCGSLTSGSILIVTVNVHPGQLQKQAEDGKQIAREAVLAQLLQRPVASIPTEATTKAGFSEYASQAIAETISSLVRTASGNALSFRLLYNFHYADGAPMVTVGGMILNGSDADLLDQCGPSVYGYGGTAERCEILTPPLTRKEKAALDTLMPRSTAITQSQVEALGFSLGKEQVLSYDRFYRLYPLFSELAS